MRKVHARFAEFRWTIRVLWSSPAMFLTSATCHLFEKRWCEFVITAIAVSHGACRHRLHFAISRNISNFGCSFRRLSCVAASRILLYTNAHHQMVQQEEPVIDTCSPRRQAIQMGHAQTHMLRKVSVFCFCFILGGILCYPILFVILIVIQFIIFY